MMRSISFKMYVLFVASLVMSISTAWSIYNLYQRQQLASEHQLSLIELQSEVSALQAQMWIYLEYVDTKSFNSLIQQQQRLSIKLAVSEYSPKKIDRVRQVNNQLAELITKDKQFQLTLKRIDIEGELVEQRRSLLNNRYNLLIQNMFDYLAKQHQVELSAAKKQMESTMVEMGILLVLFSVSMTATAFLLLRRFRVGSQTMALAIESIKGRHFTYRVQCDNLDTEFSELGQTFNAMNEELEQNLFTKSQLENEVAKQTRILEQQKVALEYLSERDPLTSLLNRRSLEAHLKSAVARSGRTNRIMAVLFLDLDKFKAINDTYGHDVGDHVLKVVAQRLKDNTRETDLVSRFGGDEFIVCLDLLSDMESVAAKTEQLLEEVTQPIVIKGLICDVGVSIGVSIYPHFAKNHTDLLKFADQAMYVAKAREGSNYMVSQENQAASLHVVPKSNQNAH
ncbi:GGDEF domain-containing protein [Vibrio mexicanus]|uniref:GGDEF domain-containing protein n=1 Tax=Vibrio mexicanus TaxID=1004326 RepID=UPI00063C30D2|nr:GGDEF domain-containing protein [Vibrio mexicanus]